MFEPDPAAQARIRDLEAKMAAMPGSRVFVGLAEEYRRAGRLNEALAVLQQGLQAHPGYLSAQISIARLFRELGRPAEAIEAFSRALAIDRENLVAAKALADIYWDTGNRVEAIKKFKLYRAISGDRSYDERINELEREIRVDAPPEVSKAPPTLPTALTEALPVPGSVPPLVPPPSFGFEELSLESSDFHSLGADTPFAPATEEAPFAPPAPPEEPFDPNATMSISLTHYPEPGLAAPPGFSEPAVLPAEDAAIPEALEAAADSVEPVPFSAPPELEPLVAADAAAESAGPANRETSPEPEEIVVPVSEPQQIPPSKTLADLYFDQGYFEDARAIYERLLEADPADAAVRQRLSELKGSPARPAAHGGPAERGMRQRQAAGLRSWLSRVQSNAAKMERA